MQAIYFPKQVVELKKEEKFQIECNHDEYSLWFDVSKTKFPSSVVRKEERSLGMTLVSRNRLSQLNDSRRNQMFLQLMKKVIWNNFGILNYF